MGGALTDGATPRYQLGSAAAFEGSGGFIDQLLDDRCDRLFAVDHADRLARHERAGLAIAVDPRSLERASPVMLDLQLGLGHLDRALVEPLGDFALLGG